jgi:hypothetical protein
MHRTLWLGIAMVVGMATWGSSAQARDTLSAPEIRRARKALAEYDLRGDGTTAVIEKLGGFARRTDDPADRREVARELPVERPRDGEDTPWL